MKNKLALLILVLSTAFISAFVSIDKNQSTPVHSNDEFDINDYSWLVGHWEGDGFGGVSEEIWAPPADGTMMGMYRHLQEGKLVFYEFLLLDETGLRLKHFHPDLKGWETQDEMVTFPMVEYSADKLELKGLTFERKGDSKMEIRLKMKRNGGIETEVFNMTRVD